MKIRNIAAGIAAAGLVAAPMSAMAATPARASAPATDESELHGGGALLAILALIAIITGIVIAAGGDDNNQVSA